MQYGVIKSGSGLRNWATMESAPALYTVGLFTTIS